MMVLEKGQWFWEKRMARMMGLEMVRSLVQLLALVKVQSLEVQKVSSLGPLFLDETLVQLRADQLDHKRADTTVSLKAVQWVARRVPWFLDLVKAL